LISIVDWNRFFYVLQYKKITSQKLNPISLDLDKNVAWGILPIVSYFMRDLSVFKNRTQLPRLE